MRFCNVHCTRSTDVGRWRPGTATWPSLPSVPVLPQKDGAVSVLPLDGRRLCRPSPSAVIPDGRDGWHHCILIFATIICIGLVLQNARLYKLEESPKPVFENSFFDAIHIYVTGLSWVILELCIASLYLSPIQMKATIIVLVVILCLGASGILCTNDVDCSPVSSRLWTGIDHV